MFTRKNSNISEVFSVPKFLFFFLQAFNFYIAGFSLHPSDAMINNSAIL